MSNFQCPYCGMTNIDCGKDGYKTPKEIEFEKALCEIEEIIDDVGDDNYLIIREKILVKIDEVKQ